MYLCSNEKMGMIRSTFIIAMLILMVACDEGHSERTSNGGGVVTVGDTDSSDSDDDENTQDQGQESDDDASQDNDQDNNQNNPSNNGNTQPTMYPNYDLTMNIGDVVPPLLWTEAITPTGQTGRLSFEDLYLNRNLQTQHSLLFAMYARDCPACEDSLKAINNRISDLNAAGVTSVLFTDSDFLTTEPLNSNASSQYVNRYVETDFAYRTGGLDESSGIDTSTWLPDFWPYFILVDLESMEITNLDDMNTLIEDALAIKRSHLGQSEAEVCDEESPEVPSAFLQYDSENPIILNTSTSHSGGVCSNDTDTFRLNTAYRTQINIETFGGGILEMKLFNEERQEVDQVIITNKVASLESTSTGFIQISNSTGFASYVLTADPL